MYVNVDADIELDTLMCQVVHQATAVELAEAIADALENRQDDIQEMIDNMSQYLKKLEQEMVNDEVSPDA